MKTLFFSGNSAWGMYNFRRDVLAHFVQQGHRVVVAVPQDEEFVALLRQVGCEVLPMPMNAKGTNPIQDIRVYSAYLRLLRHWRPDFCFFYTIKPNIYGSMAAGRLHIPHIAFTTGLGYVFMHQTLVSRLARRLYKYAFRKANRVWFLNTDDEAAFRRYGLVREEQMYVVQGGEGIDLSRFACQDLPEQPVFLLSARMLWDKGVGAFAEAARRLKSRYPQAVFRLLGFVGVDNPSAIPQAQIAQWQQAGLLEYQGATSDVRPYIAACSCVVLPSYREGVPFSLLEGAAMGRPLITTDATGCRETVEEGKNGFLCQPKDVDSLVEAMEKIILLSPQERKQMGLHGRKKVEQEFSLERVIAQYDVAIHGHTSTV